MNTRTLGADLTVSAVGLGCMGFSHAYGAPTEKNEAIRSIRAACDLGYTLFDTAETYGTAADPHENEKLVGEALKDVRDKVQIVTKFGIRFDETSTAVQNRYSMMARQHEALFPVLEELHIGFVAFSPMANGLLTGAYGKDSRFDPRLDYRSAMPQFTPEAAEQNRALLELLRDLAERKRATPAQISLAWMLCKKPYIVPIPGSRKVERMRENAGAAEVVLSPAEVEALDKALDTIPMSAVFGGTAAKSR